MTPIKTTLCTLLTTLALTACGGGGSDVVVLSPSANTATTNNSTTNSSTANNSTNSTTGGGLSAKDTTKTNTPTTINTSIQGVVASVNGGKVAGIGASTATAKIDTVVIGNKSIDLGSNFKTGGGLSNARYGYLSQNGTTPTLVVQGLVASQVPTSGKATYKGKAVHLTSAGSQVVSASFDVNFDKKTLTGSINGSGGVNLGATISGNRFSGTAGDYSTTGYFYGEKADELGGIYKNGDGSISGAYGAKK